MTRLKFSVLLSLAFLACERISSASAISYVPADGISTDLEDEDWEMYIPKGGDIEHSVTDGKTIFNTPVSPGDYFVGMVRIDAVEHPADQTPAFKDFPSSGETISALFAIKVAPRAVGSTLAFSAVALDDSEWASIGLNALGFTRSSSSTVAIVFDDSLTGSKNIQVDPKGSDLDIRNDLKTVNGNRVWELGFGPGSYWSVINFTAIPPVTAIGVFTAGLDVTKDYGLANGLLQHVANTADVNTGIPVGTHQVEIVVGTATAPVTTSDFDFTSHSTFRLTALAPEPGSMVLLGMGALGFFGVGARRRRRSVKQQAV